jgi:capsular polysaccharide biosynthesis protein
MLGGDKIESILADFGFIAADPAALTFAEQVLLLQNVECVVAPIGAALANLIFAPPGRKVIALAPYYRGADYYYFSNLMGVLGRELYFILGAQIDQPEVHRLNRDYMANVQALRGALERLCSR